MKVTMLTADTVQATAIAAGYTLQEVCATLPDNHEIERDFYVACMCRYDYTPERAETVKNQLISKLATAMAQADTKRSD